MHPRAGRFIPQIRQHRRLSLIHIYGYEAVCVGFDAIRPKLVNKPTKGQFDKAGVAPCRFIREMKLEDSASYEIGQEIKADVFEQGDRVDVSGVSRGHGFTGVTLRWNQHRGPITHGSKYHRCLLYTSRCV